MLGILLILNLVDAIATSVWVMLGIASETNPLMAAIIDFSPSFFILFKIVFVTICTYFLWTHRQITHSRLLVIPVISLYSYICCIHAFALLCIIQRTIL